jgi:serine/threonine protein phosphatase PrpC
MTDCASGDGLASLSFRWGAATDRGKVRERNEDAYVVEPEAGLFVVIDGMGGHRGGHVAAGVVAQDLPPMIENAVDKLKTRNPRSVRRLLRRAIAEQSRHLCWEADSESGYVGMGATLVVVLLLGGRVYAANAGDSRIYRLRRGRLTQLSADHSVVSELLEAGHITPDEAQNHSAQGVVTQYMGMPEGVQPRVRSAALRAGDRFLLCSDGLTDLLDERAIAEILAAQIEPQAACDRLVEAANRAGGTDNITVVVVNWEEPP